MLHVAVEVKSEKKKKKKKRDSEGETAENSIVEEAPGECKYVWGLAHTAYGDAIFDEHMSDNCCWQKLKRCEVMNRIQSFLLPANEVCEGYVFTPVSHSTGMHSCLWIVRL